MCGIAGLVGGSLGPAAKELLERQVDSIRHRGPDATGITILDGVAFGMARLSIVEVKGGQQPAFSKSGKVMVVFNGEIYNYRELRRLNSGLDESMPEAEVIANLFEIEGINFVSKLDGFFSIAVWDSRDKGLYLIRDRFGKKPLYYSHTDELFVFGSEVKSLLKAGLSASPDFEAIQEVLRFGHVKAPRTGYQGIYQVLPASIIEFKDQQIKEWSYWKLQGNDEFAGLSLSEATEIYNIKLRSAVEKRLNAERPLGLFLSGGIDSSLIAVALRDLKANSVEAFSVGFSEREFDESVHASEIARFLGLNHHKVLVRPSPDFFVSIYPKFMDIPYADSSFMPTFLLSESASAQIKVALSGDGGDEAFGGYDRYRANLFLDRFFKFCPEFSIEFNKRVKGRRSTKLLRSLGYSNFVNRYESTLELLTQREIQELLIPLDFEDTLKASTSYRERVKSLSKKMQAMQHHDVNQYLPGDLLVKMDMASMASGLEVRSPFLDPDLFQFGYSLSSDLKVSKKKGKLISRNLLGQALPSNLFERPKQGFAIPRAHWLRTSMKSVAAEILFSEDFRSRGWFSQDLVRKAFLKHQKGWDLDEYLWPILMTEIWAINWIDHH